MNRGSAKTGVRRWQPSLRFNEAPIHESGKCLRYGTRRHPHLASMRPRFMNRGSKAEGVKLTLDKSLQ